MRKKITTILAIAFLLVSAVALTGCTEDEGDSGGTNEYHNDASEYLLAESVIDGDWTKNKTREPNSNPTGMESGRVINFDRNGDNLTIAVIVLETIEDAKNLTDDQRDTYKNYGELSEQDLGDESFSFSYMGANWLNIRLSNVYIQLYGDPMLNPLKGYGQQQIDAIKG